MTAFLRAAPFSPALRRPSALLRALWLAVALLHGWLIAERFVLGAWGAPMDWLRALLCVAGIGYATLKFWRISTVFDQEPRRALIFAFILVLGHFWIAPPETQTAYLNHAEQTAASLLIVVPAVGLALLLALAARRLHRALPVPTPNAAGLPLQRPLPLRRLKSHLFQRHLPVLF
ncbi:MAG TPA: hypothetical protein PLS90_06535 [Candidatus Sumerlaeota bacterium]|nr:hypothetical protein [Candidatus Sumerlaeota bacterium]HOR28916.1 hypothetical protein [Candidatus Sumerlaeota bacterium]HPK02097.1 hypothetical protein [Candidatus Sumerlaeota bacterium]